MPQITIMRSLPAIICEHLVRRDNASVCVLIV